MVNQFNQNQGGFPNPNQGGFPNQNQGQPQFNQGQPNQNQSQKRSKLEELGVQHGDEAYIHGEVAFARLDKLVEGEELQKAAEMSKSKFPPNRPFRSVTIKNPVIVNPQNSPLEQWWMERVYTSGNGDVMLEIDSKSRNAPQFGHIQNGAIVEIPDPHKNPAIGQGVTVQVRAFGSKTPGYNMGSAFNGIIYDEGPINFYEGGASLSGFGDALNMPVVPLSEQNQNQNQEQNQQNNNPYQNQEQDQNQFNQNPNQNTGFEAFNNPNSGGSDGAGPFGNQ